MSMPFSRAWHCMPLYYLAPRVAAFTPNPAPCSTLWYSATLNLMRKKPLSCKKASKLDHIYCMPTELNVVEFF